MKVFPLSLADDARQLWINEGHGKITNWKDFVEKFLCKFYPLSRDDEDEILEEGDNLGLDPLEFISRVNSIFKNHMRVDGTTKKALLHSWINENWNKEPMKDIVSSDEEWEESDYGNHPNITTDSSFKPYLNAQENAPKSDNQNNEQPSKRVCKAEKFEVIKYSLGPNEEYIVIISCEYNAWERNKDSVSHIYQDIFRKKGQGVLDLEKAKDASSIKEGCAVLLKKRCPRSWKGKNKNIKKYRDYKDTLIQIKAAKPKVRYYCCTTTTNKLVGQARGVVVLEAIVKFRTLPKRNSSQCCLDEDLARNLQAQLEAELIEEERLARKQEEEANITLIESWDNTQAMMEADFELAQRLQTEEQGEITIEERSRLFVELINKRKKHFAMLKVKRKEAERKAILKKQAQRGN
ncbi:hypothetical protein Tco_0808188 [Tanacetum coccineum]